MMSKYIQSYFNLNLHLGSHTGEKPPEVVSLLCDKNMTSQIDYFSPVVNVVRHINRFLRGGLQSFLQKIRLHGCLGLLEGKRCSPPEGFPPGGCHLGCFPGHFDSEKIRHDKVSVGSYTC